ncbi:MAG TPA: hypothetical protein PKX55_15690, partial [Leptospiraceae bacterium]|nr:hypothetical protein [Leptospiraceae bacterium]
TGYIYNNEENKPIGGIIIIDSNVIQQKANDWITFKENSVFDKSNTELKIQIEDDKNNTLENALRYILLHEIGHILSNVYRITPDARNKTLDYSNHSFLNKIWKTETDSYYDSSEFPFRKNISFYAAPDKKINLDTDWKKIYPVLLKYRFPTMYSATNASDYFAEMFVSYVHCILDKKPWKLSIYQSNKEIYSIENGIHFLHEEREFIRKSIFLKEL